MLGSVVGVVEEANVPEIELANTTEGVVFGVEEEDEEEEEEDDDEEDDEEEDEDEDEEKEEELGVDTVEWVGVAANEAVEGVVWKVDVVGGVILLCALKSSMTEYLW